MVQWCNYPIVQSGVTMEDWELAAREQIRDLIARYAHCADAGRFRDLVMLFTEEGELEIVGQPPLRGRLAIEAFLEGARETTAARLTHPHLRHHVSSLEIEVHDPETASAASYFMVLTDGGLDHWGTYRDRFIQIGERWFFAYRRVRIDGRAS